MINRITEIGWWRRRPVGVGHPARLVVLGFGAAVLVGTALLMLPAAGENGRATDIPTALFTATSAVCATGPVVVDTATYWSTFGALVVLDLIQTGGLGVMTLATLLGLLVARRLGLRMQLTAHAETKNPGLGEVRGMVWRWRRSRPPCRPRGSPPATTWGGPGGLRGRVPHGLGVQQRRVRPPRHQPDPVRHRRLDRGARDGRPGHRRPGFPVLFEIGRRRRLRRWSPHARITLPGFAALTALGVVAITTVEWSNSLDT